MIKYFPKVIQLLSARLDPKLPDCLPLHLYLHGTKVSLRNHLPLEFFIKIPQENILFIPRIPVLSSQGKIYGQNNL